MLAKVNSSAVVGLDSVPIEVEVDIASQGLPSFTIVGLPDKAVEESKERVRSAIKNTGADFPAKRITVNLAPADLPKEGPSYDLPIALGILLASEQLSADISNSLFIGELSLDGALRHVTGALPQVVMAKNKNIKSIFLPKEDSREASFIKGVDIFPVPSLFDLFNHLSGKILLGKQKPVSFDSLKDNDFEFDLKDIKGQEQAKRALEIAAAGGHNILMKGPPGAGKTLLARTLPSILPRPTFEEALEITKIYSISGLLENQSLIITRPFRSPHHTTSHIGLIGGGTSPKPGDITLANRGVLFLDEFPEFPRHVLEAMRQPLEDGFITISRAAGRINFPAKFMLVAAQNPCPCGFLGDPTHECRCMPGAIIKYQKRVSGPMLDRIDIHLDVPAVKLEKLVQSERADNVELSSQVRKRVQKARDIQIRRFAKKSIRHAFTLTTGHRNERDKKIISNSEMSSKDIKVFCVLDEEGQNLLKQAVSRLNLSARSYSRILKIARTIADLEGEKNIAANHIAEALQYRPKTDSF